MATLISRNALTTLADGDLAHVVDVSDTSSSSDGTSKKITASNIKNYMFEDNVDGVTLGTLGGSANTYTATPTLPITAYVTGMEFNMKVNADNTGAATLNVSAVGAKSVKKYDGAGAKVALIAGDLQQDQYYKVIYDGTDFVVLNPEIPSRTVGAAVQVVNTQVGNAATGSTVIPHDDTIPQNTEGDQYMSLAITPTSSTNKLKIEIQYFSGQDTATDTTTVALFQDSTANALAAGQAYVADASKPSNLSMTHYMTTGTTSATTFKVRAGGTTGVHTFNGEASGRRYGGVMASSITITEIQV